MMRLLFVALLLAAASGCKKKRELPARYDYHLVERGQGEGGELFIADQSVAKLKMPESRERDVESANPDEARVVEAFVFLPFGEPFLSAGKHLQVRYQTPCGPTGPFDVKFVTPSAEEEKKKIAAMVSGDTTLYDIDATVEVPGSEGPPGQIQIDWGSSPNHPQVKVGALVLPYRESDVPYIVPDWRCEASHEVSIDGIKVGAIDARQPNQKPRPPTFLIAVEPDVCYRQTAVNYAGTVQRQGMTSQNELLRGARVYPLRGRPTYFLRTAPGSKRGTLSELEVVRESCTQAK